MTAVVGIRCKDGVVIGADSSATFGDGGGPRGVIEQSTSRKIEIIGESVIVAGTGAVGHMQRFSPVIQGLWNQKAFQGKDPHRNRQDAFKWYASGGGGRLAE